jgi:GAF domain-containing protein
MPDENSRPTPNDLERRLQAIAEIGVLFESTMSRDDVLDRIVTRTAELMEAERSTLYLFDDEGVLVSRVFDRETPTDIRLLPGQGIAGWVARNDKGLRVDDAYEDDRFDEEWDRRTGFRTRAVACQPIHGRHGEVIGVIEVLNKRAAAVFLQDDSELLALLAGQLTLIIENARLLIDLMEKNQELIATRGALSYRVKETQLLLDLEQRVAEAVDLDALFPAVLERTLKETQAQVALLYRLDDCGAETRVLRADEPVVRVLRVSAGTGFVGWVAEKGAAVCLEAPTADARFARQLERRIGVSLDSVAAVPMRECNEAPAIGTLLVANKRGETSFSDRDLKMLNLIAGRIVRAMAHVGDREEFERERRLATVGRLMAGVLHDIKSPLASIMGYSELLAESSETPEADQYSAAVQRAVDQIAAMAEEIIAFSKGDRELLLSKVRVDELMQRLVEQLETVLLITTSSSPASCAARGSSASMWTRFYGRFRTSQSTPSRRWIGAAS